MPLPFIIGAGAIAAAALAAKKGYDGYHKHSEADEIIKDARGKYDRAKEMFDEQESATNDALERLGKKELDIGVTISKFKTLADDLIGKISTDEAQFKLDIPSRNLQKIEEYSYTAVGVMGTVFGGAASGAAVGFAVYGGVMSLGAASTGTAISALSGAAATKATLAALGGGSLAAGGLGIAGGTAILSAAVAAPILAIAGFAYDSHGEEALKNAKKSMEEVNDISRKMSKAVTLLQDVEEYSGKVKRTVGGIYKKFLRYYDVLEEINSFLEDVKGHDVDVDAKLAEFNDQVMTAVGNGYALAAILVDLVSTPIFKVKGSDENGVPLLDKDEDGLNVLNDDDLDKAIAVAESKANEIEGL